MLHRFFRIQVQRREEYKPQRGFTAIELMVVVAILAILTALALPSFTDMVRRYRVKRAVEDIAATLQLAKVESIKRGGGVTLRKASSAGCSTSMSQEWSCGWLIFLDTNSNGALNTGEITLLSSPPPKGVVVMATKNSMTYAKFDRWGQAGGVDFGFIVQSDEGEKSAPLHLTTAICLSSGGRIRILLESPECPK